MSIPYGLVVAGGKSSRMGTDKACISYHGQPQQYHLYDMLKRVCGEAYISCNSQQQSAILATYNTIADDKAYQDSGPMAAIPSAFNKFPRRSFIAIGCDYPGVNEEHITMLMNALSAGSTVAFFNDTTGFYEPMLAGYHFSILPHLHEQYKAGNNSLQYLFRTLQVHKIALNSLLMPQSIDTPADRLAFQERQQRK